MNFGLKEETINKINSVFEKIDEVQEVIIYGSRAKGNFKTGSDIDLTLKGKNITSNILSRVKDKIDELSTPYLFDISIFDKLTSADLKDHIDRAGKIFYTKKSLPEA